MGIGGTTNLVFVTSFYQPLTERPQYIEKYGIKGQQKTEVSTIGDSNQLKFAHRSIVQLQQNLESLRTPLTTNRIFKVRTATQAGQAVSTTNIGLTTTAATATTLQSTEEINTAATSFTPLGPNFTGFGVSTAQATLSGVYDGDNGTGDLTFRVIQGGTHGTDDMSIRVFNPDDTFYEDITISRFDLINTPYVLSNGLILTLGSGDLVELDDFQVSVDSSVPTSYSPSSPEWNGATSTAAATIGGVYDGSDGSGTYTFQVTQGGIHGQDNLSINVLKPDQTLLETISIASSDPIGNLHTLSNGLTFSLAAGDLLQDDEFTVEVFHNVGSAVDPDNPFNGTRNSNPNFQNGLSVAAGTFDVNGESIQVLASDTISQIISKINTSNAGVTASFNAGSEIIEFTQNTLGAAPTIILENDTSGFLAATKLSAATSVVGQDAIRDEDRALSTLAQFSSVQTGNILINSVSIAINVLSDTLNDILTRITNSAAEVNASLSGGQNVSIVANTANDSVGIDSNATNFFAAVNISDGTFQASAGGTRNIVQKGIPSIQRQQFGDSIKEVSKTLNLLFNDAKLTSKPGSLIQGLRKDLQNIITEELGQSGSQFSTDLGLNFDFKTTNGQSFKVIDIDGRQISKTLRNDVDSLSRAFLGSTGEGKQGLTTRLSSILNDYGSSLSALGTTGAFLNVTA